MNFGVSATVATVIDTFKAAPEPRRGHPPAATIRAVATLQQFLREGTPWRRPRATADRVSGATLRRHLREWAEGKMLAQGHAVLIAMLRGDPILIPDSCAVRAKRGGDLTGPNPTDRGKRGTKYHLAVTGNGVPVACAVTAANVHDTTLFERLLLVAFAVRPKIRRAFADKGYDAERHRALCHRFGIAPHIHKRGRPSGPRLGNKRWPVERSHAWILDNRRLALRCDRLGFIVQSLLQAARIFLVAGRLAREL